MPQVPAIRHDDPRLVARKHEAWTDPYVERLEPKGSPKGPEGVYLPPPDGGAITKRPNWLLIGAAGAAGFFMLIAAIALGGLIAGSGSDTETVRALTGLVKDLTSEMSAMRDVEAERMRIEAAEQAHSNAEMKQLLEYGVIAIAGLIILGVCGTYGGFPGLVLGVFIILGIAGVFSGAVELS
ncbi:MAG: hypothetical protein ACR2RF_03770 [Geminicoccaceae bacterium]